MFEAARRIGDPEARVELYIPRVCHKCSFRPRKIADQVIRYLDKAAKKCMQDEEEYHACPNAECSWGLYRAATIDAITMLISNLGAYFAKGDGNIFSCKMCKARYCLVCEVPFHEEQTCDDYQANAKRRSEDEQKSLEAVKQVSRPCPGPGCGVNIDKWTGCDHVTCKKTKYSIRYRIAADCCDRPEMQARVLLAMFCSLQRSNWYPASRELRPQGKLPTLLEQAAVLQAACRLLMTATTLGLDGLMDYCGHTLWGLG